MPANPRGCGSWQSSLAVRAAQPPHRNTATMDRLLILIAGLTARHYATGPLWIELQLLIVGQKNSRTAEQ